VRNPAKLLKTFWLPPRDSNPDMLIQSQLSYGSYSFPRFPWPVCKLLSFQNDEPHLQIAGNACLMP
jgi:hypothetical protein